MTGEPRILYVENDPVWLDRLPPRIEEALRLSGLQGTIRTAATYREAKELLGEPNDWDLLVTDIGLGDDDNGADTRGMDLVSTSRRRSIPCLVVTGTKAVTTKNVRDLIFDYKVCDVFDKLTFPDEDFIATVRRVLLGATKTRESGRLIRLFFSYSHKDEEKLADLCTHLAILVHQGYIVTWHDREMVPGQELDAEIKKQLDSADIICFIVSSDFLASYYCFEVEMRRAFERHEAGEAEIIPVILRPCDWKLTPLSKYLSLPKDGKPVTRWPDRDTAWLDVARGIRRVVDRMRSREGS